MQEYFLPSQLAKCLCVRVAKCMRVYTKAKNDVRPFIKEMAELELWSEAFFKQIIHDIAIEA